MIGFIPYCNTPRLTPLQKDTGHVENGLKGGIGEADLVVCLLCFQFFSDSGELCLYYTMKPSIEQAHGVRKGEAQSHAKRGFLRLLYHTFHTDTSDEKEFYKKVIGGLCPFSRNAKKTARRA